VKRREAGCDVCVEWESGEILAGDRINQRKYWFVEFLKAILQ
jgi:hypothetical protein